MPTSRSSPAKKRQLTVFDLPPVGSPEFPTHIRNPSTTIFHKQRPPGDVGPRTPRNKLISFKAHLRLRELTENDIGPTWSLTSLELDKIARDYLANRSKSTDSWFHPKQRFFYQNPTVLKQKPAICDASTQLSVLPPITSQGEPILRRPTVLQSKSIPEGGDVFNVILKNKELMPFSFQGDLKMTRDFYASHYPLLMRKMMDVSPPSSRRNSFVTEEMVREIVRYTSAERRAMKMEEKRAAMDAVLRDLEEEDEDGIVTELRHDVFNPLEWPWNKNIWTLDVAKCSVIMIPSLLIKDRQPHKSNIEYCLS